MQDPSYAQVHQGSVAGEPDLLDSLFDALDVSDKGYLEVPEMKRLGLVLTGTTPTSDATVEQIRRADTDMDGRISREEWREFSQVLTKMKPADLKELLWRLRNQVQELNDNAAASKALREKRAAQ